MELKKYWYDFSKRVFLKGSNARYMTKFTILRIERPNYPPFKQSPRTEIGSNRFKKHSLRR